MSGVSTRLRGPGRAAGAAARGGAPGAPGLSALPWVAEGTPAEQGRNSVAVETGARNFADKVCHPPARGSRSRRWPIASSSPQPPHRRRAVRRRSRLSAGRRRTPPNPAPPALETIAKPRHHRRPVEERAPGDGGRHPRVVVDRPQHVLDRERARVEAAVRRVDELRRHAAIGEERRRSAGRRPRGRPASVSRSSCSAAATSGGILRVAEEVDAVQLLRPSRRRAQRRRRATAATSARALSRCATRPSATRDRHGEGVRDQDQVVVAQRLVGEDEERSRTRARARAASTRRHTTTDAASPATVNQRNDRVQTRRRSSRAGARPSPSIAVVSKW